VNKLLKILVALVLFLVVKQDLNAQNLLTESFNYTSGGALVGSNWTLVTGSEMVHPINVNRGNLTYTGSIASGIGNRVILRTSGQDAYRSFPSTNAPIYSSLLVDVSAANATGDFFYSLFTSIFIN